MKKTRKEKVLDHLYERGGWVDGYDLCSPAIGGSEGLRRLRELRAEGWVIEKRLKPNRPKGSTVYQYRLVSTAPRKEPDNPWENSGLDNTLFTQHTSHGR